MLVRLRAVLYYRLRGMYLAAALPIECCVVIVREARAVVACVASRSGSRGAVTGLPPVNRGCLSTGGGGGARPGCETHVTQELGSVCVCDCAWTGDHL